MKRLLTTIAVGLAGIQGLTLVAGVRPKLVVGIMVDQLRDDYLENLKDYFSEGGFRRLMDKGLYLKDVDFNVPGGDAASSSAIIQTGAYPRHNGVASALVYDQASKKLRPVFLDESFLGNFTNETYSPGALRVSTLADEVAIDGRGLSRIHSIAPDAAQAIVLAGHAGNSAFWLNEESGRWSSTTYYSNPPAHLQNRNYAEPLVSRLDTLKWTPSFSSDSYPFVPSHSLRNGFKYTFSRSDRDVFSLYKKSPMINADITEAATEYIADLNLGKSDESIDVLNLGYSLAAYPALSDSDYRYELEDAYLRLDRNLEQLFSALDKYVGKDNVLIYLVSSGYFSEPEEKNDIYRLPGGTFSVKRAMSLLNAFLSAKYGNGAYVDEYDNSQIYLSEPVLEEKNLDPVKISEEARDFLVRMSGIADAYTITDLMSPSVPQMEAHRLSIDPKVAGNIILEFNPGWKVVDDTRFPNVVQENKSTAYSTPGFIMGNGINPKVVEETVEAVAIAPTVAKALRIRAPNSAAAKPLSLK